MRRADEGAAILGAQASGDDDLAVLVQRLADGVERFRHGRVDEAAGVDDDQVGTVIGGRNRVALGAQLRQDLLGIDERLGAAEGDEADPGCGFGVGSRLYGPSWRCELIAL